MKKTKSVKLNLGCGHTKYPGFLGVDNNKNAEFVDIVHDLNKFPYPFKASTVDEVLMDHVLEHLDDPLLVVQELYRICKPGGLIRIKVPHFSCTWLHPGHKSALSTMLFDYFVPGTDDYYGNCEFEVLEKKLSWIRPENPARPVSKRSPVINVASAIISFFANLHQGFCQRVWCYWVGGFEEISFRAKVVKRSK